MKAAIYVRLSVDVTGDAALARQEADCRSYCSSRGWEVENLYSDVLSGYKDVRRPGFEACLSAVDERRAAALVVWKLDRLSRHGIRELGPVLARLEAAGAVLVGVQDGIDTSSGAGELLVGVMASIARQESQNISVRVARALLENARAGRPHGGGHRAFGFSSAGDSVVADEAALVVSAASSVLAGVPLSSIARKWAQEGVLTPAGNPFRVSVLRNMLCSDRIAGNRAHGGATYPGAWPALVTPDVSEAVRALLRTGRKRAPVRRYLLTGILECGRCGRPLYSRPRADGTRSYQCVSDPGAQRDGCGRLRVVADAVEGLVERVVQAFLEQADLRTPAAPSGGGTALELAALRGRLEGLETAFFVEGSLSRGRFVELRAEIVDRIAVAEGLMALASPVGDARWDIGLEWSALDLEQRRSVVRAWFPRVVVDPAPGSGRLFRPGRVRLVDRNGEEWGIRPGEAGGLEAFSGPKFVPLGD